MHRGHFSIGFVHIKKAFFVKVYTRKGFFFALEYFKVLEMFLAIPILCV